MTQADMDRISHMVKANGLRIVADIMRTATEPRPSLWRRCYRRVLRAIGGGY